MATFPNFLNPAVDGALVSATDINTLIDAITAVEGLAQRGQDVQPIGYDDRATFGGRIGFRTEEILWRGGFTWRTSMTDVMFRINATPSGAPNAVFRFYINGALTDTQLVVSGVNVYSLDVSSGYSNGETVAIRMSIFNPDAIGGEYDWDTYAVDILEVYATPVPLPAAAPPPVAVNSTATYNELVASVDWLLDIVRRRTEPLFLGVVRAPSVRYGARDIRWLGRFRGVATWDKIETTIVVVVPPTVTGAVRTLELYLDGVLVDSETIASASGEYTYQLTTTFTPVVDQIYTVEIRTLADIDDETLRFSLFAVRNVPNTPTYLTPLVPIARATGGAPISGANLALLLESIALVTAALQGRFTAASIWEIQYLGLRSYRRGIEEWEVDEFDWMFVPVRVPRYGVRLRTYGSTALLGWINSEFEPLGDTISQRWNAIASTAITGNDEGIAVNALDQYVGLVEGVPYNIRGARLEYAGEDLA